MKHLCEALRCEHAFPFSRQNGGECGLRQDGGQCSSDTELGSRVQEYVSRLAELLVEARSDPDTDAGRRAAVLVRITQSLGKGCKVVSSP